MGNIVHVGTPIYLKFAHRVSLLAIPALPHTTTMTRMVPPRRSEDDRNAAVIENVVYGCF